MSWISLTLLAVALAMDAFAVAIASGIAIKNLRIRHALTIAAWFGVFQAIMPILGWWGGRTISDIIAPYDHWIIFVLLAGIGMKMIVEAFTLEPIERQTDPLDIYVLFALSIATSLDALAAGVSFAFLNVAIVTPVVVIGGVAFVASFAGVWIGNHGCHFFEKKMEIVAGCILIGLGIKVVIEHCVA